MISYIVVIVLYALFLIGVGFIMSKRVKTADDFFVGGRKLGPALLFITLVAPNIGAGSTVGVAGLSFKTGLSAVWWITASAVGTFILAFIIGPYIWELAKKHNFYTLGDYFEYRYNKNFRGLISSFMLIGTVAIFAGQLMGIAWILSVIANIDKGTGVLIGAVVIVLYFCTGGLLSAAYVNIVEACVKLIGFFIAVPFVFSFVGGLDGLQAKAAANMVGTATTATDYFSLSGIGIGAIIGFFLMLTPSFFLSPALIGKVYAAKDKKTARLSTFLCGLVMLVFAIVPVFLGMAAFALFPDLPQRDLALPYIMKECMPFWASAIALAAIFSAEISAADAVLYMITGSFSKDLYKSFINPLATDKKLLRMSRLAAVVAGLIGIFLASVLPNVISALSIFYSLMSVSLTAPLIFGLFCRRTSTTAAFSSAGSGVVITIILQIFNAGNGFGIFNAQSVAIIFSIFVMLVFVGFYPRKQV
ncbi:sodium:solute symporter family protein [Pectinatus cerevisiiphilus]|uniref:SSS family solute:Na+ symporter n=1 Tax=Pectinatus cerevisiiphilus TaxID=86956 RepID=A0A4R3KFQ7_9FIRM|nr:sodium:solute symporter family protein [Pectinatus cerevisiiphilus]TCS81839.1 SSS family solute:Na+ symporter [Pectinatus cerevisiiphilus]